MNDPSDTPAPDPARPDECSCASEAGLPDWVPQGSENDPRFACRVMSGVTPTHLRHKPAKRRKLTLDDYERGVLAGDVGLLSRAITLVESNLPEHEAMAQELLTRMLPKTGNNPWGGKGKKKKAVAT